MGFFSWWFNFINEENYKIASHIKEYYSIYMYIIYRLLKSTFDNDLLHVCITHIKSSSFSAMILSRNICIKKWMLEPAINRDSRFMWYWTRRTERKSHENAFLLIFFFLLFFSSFAAFLILFFYFLQIQVHLKFTFLFFSSCNDSLYARS